MTNPDRVHVTMETSMGTIEIELFAKEAKATVDNFLKYVDDGFYNGLIFHRVISGFMIQGGGFTEQMSKKAPRPGIKNEANNGLKNTMGTLAMARTQDPHSGSSQFFINHRDNASLDHTSMTTAGWGYAVFGKVSTASMAVVNKIAATPTGRSGPYQDVPQTPVVIKSVARAPVAQSANSK